MADKPDDLRLLIDEEIAEIYIRTFAFEHIYVDNPFKVDEIGLVLNNAEAQALRNIAKEALAKVDRLALDRPVLKKEIADLCRIMREEGKIRRFTPESDADQILLLIPDEDEIRKQVDIKWIKALMRGGIMVSEPEQLEGIGKRIAQQEKERLASLIVPEIDLVHTGYHGYASQTPNPNCKGCQIEQALKESE